MIVELALIMSAAALAHGLGELHARTRSEARRCDKTVDDVLAGGGYPYREPDTRDEEAIDDRRLPAMAPQAKCPRCGSRRTKIEYNICDDEPPCPLEQHEHARCLSCDLHWFEQAPEHYVRKETVG